jgi:hypothetical protein
MRSPFLVVKLAPQNQLGIQGRSENEQKHVPCAKLLLHACDCPDTMALKYRASSKHSSNTRWTPMCTVWSRTLSTNKISARAASAKTAFNLRVTNEKAYNKQMVKRKARG